MARILLIDDDHAVRVMFQQILERAGHLVVEAGEGVTGVRLYREQPADLVIVDIFMPDQDGLETIQQLRREFAQVKIIVISGGGRTGDIDLREVATTFGAQRTLWKPISMTMLLDTVDELLQS